MGEREERLIIVSNRGPAEFGRGPDGERTINRGGGGLVTALTGLATHREVLWVASAMSEEDAVVAEEGVAAKMEQVASRAGVGIGTLYRFVPTKDALFSTILGEQADRLADLAERALALPQGESAFHTWMAEAAAWQSSNKAFINVLAARDPATWTVVPVAAGDVRDPEEIAADVWRAVSAL